MRKIQLVSYLERLPVGSLLYKQHRDKQYYTIRPLELYPCEYGYYPALNLSKHCTLHRSNVTKEAIAFC